MAHPSRPLEVQYCRGAGEAFAGLLIIALPLQAYSMYVSSIPTFSSLDLPMLEDFGYLVLAFTLLGLLFVALGLRKLFNELGSSSRSTPVTFLVISKVLNKGVYRQIMAAATLLYGIFFAIIAGIIVYRPMENFAQEYFIQIPSALLAVCCGSAGLVPVLTVFVTIHLGLLIIPANILILAAVSELVGLNTMLTVCVYHNRPRDASGRWLLGLGAFTGLFTACPTCAGLFFSTIVVALGSSALVILPSTQIYFAVGTVLLLLGGAYFSTRVLGQAVLGQCAREPESH